MPDYPSYQEQGSPNCRDCGAPLPSAAGNGPASTPRFYCPLCGTPIGPIDCAACGSQVCPHCGTPAELIDELGIG